MKKDKLIINISVGLNFLVALIKLISGIALNFSTLVSDSLHSFSDFITDVISLIANTISKKRATKKYPFGFGMAENIANLFIGIILFGLASYIFIEGLHSTQPLITPTVFIVLIIVILLKLIICYILYYNGKKLKKPSLIVSAKESLADATSSIIVLIVAILLLFKDTFPILKYANQIGNIIISFIVYKISLKIIVENVCYLIGKNDQNNKELINIIKNKLDQFKQIKHYKYDIIQFGSYYTIYIEIELDPKINLTKVSNLENKLKTELKKSTNIKFVEIDSKPWHKN